jgi:alpha,alpha-trehalose phosphorylase
VEWTSFAGQAVRALDAPGLLRAALDAPGLLRAALAGGDPLRVEPLGASARLVVQCELLANEPVPEQTDDARAAALRAPLVAEEHRHHDLRAVVSLTRSSGLSVAAGMDHVVDDPKGRSLPPKSNRTSPA